MNPPQETGMYRNTQVVPATEVSNANNFAPPQRVRRKSEMRRSGTMAIQKMQTDLQAGNQNQAGSGINGDLNGDGHLSIDERMALTLSKSQKKGIVSSRSLAGMAAFKKANLLDDPHSVVHQSLAIQSEFRLKIMFSFIAQMGVMYAVMLVCLFTPTINNWIVSDFESPVYRLCLILATGITLGIVFCIKYRPPISQIAMIAWTIFNGFVMAALSRHGASNAFHQIFGVSIVGLIIAALISQRKVGHGTDRHLYSVLTSGVISVFITLTISAVLQGMNVYQGQWGHWISANVLSIMIILWICYDTELLAHKMEKSEWAQCIVFYMTDLALLFLFCCLICICCCMGENACGDGADAGGGADVGAGGAEAAGDVGNLA